MINFDRDITFKKQHSSFNKIKFNDLCTYKRSFRRYKVNYMKILYSIYAEVDIQKKFLIKILRI